MKKGNKICSLFLAILLLAGLIIGAVPMVAHASELPGLADLGRQAATEGAVLLRNDTVSIAEKPNKTTMLPLGPEDTVSIFGRHQVDSFYCGYGSGGLVIPSYKTSILSGIRQNPLLKINEELAGVYEDWSRKNPAQTDGWSAWPFHHPEMPITDEQVSAAAAKSDSAIVIIGRAAGEDREASIDENAGSYYLTANEKKLLSQVNDNFEHVIILLNIGNIFDMKWLDDYANIDSILCVWQGGMDTGKAVADLLSGVVNPSGKMMSTIAKQHTDYPSTGNYGAGGHNNYVEDIFVGYRYFETFEPDKVLYPFGYGLSYTSFETKTTAVKVQDEKIVVEVNVTNKGAVKGKEVVQVYFGAPQGKLGKAKKSLAAFGKTDLLSPGASQDMTLTFNIKDMASYDDAGKTGHKSAYVLEAGDYPVYVGNSVRDAQQVSVNGEPYAYKQPALRVVEQLQEAAAPTTVFDRIVAYQDGNEIKQKKESVPQRTNDTAKRIKDNIPASIPQTGDKGHKLVDVATGKVDIKDFVAQLSVPEMARMARGAGGMQSSKGTPGNAGVYGGVESELVSYGITPVSCHDGPSGIRIEGLGDTSLIPIGTLLACTWNLPLVEELYNVLGKEMIENEVDILLAPGLNIHRNPLNGRNFEYFSEDPLLTGTMGSAVTRGIQSEGCGVTLKHFALNNQEHDRMRNDSRVSERAMREIYLKGFEIAVKTSNPYTIMSAFNKVNGTYCYYDYDLMTTILREEWGYDGMVMSDWSYQEATDPNNADIKSNAYRIQAQHDVYMPGETGANNANIEDSINSGKGITIGQLQRSAINTLKSVMRMPVFARTNGMDYYKYEPGEMWFSTNSGEKGQARLKSLKVNGEALSNFNELKLDYYVFTRDPEAEFDVVAEPADGFQVETTTATASGTKMVNIRVYSESSETNYRLYYGNIPGWEPVAESPVYALLSDLKIDSKSLQEFYPSSFKYSAYTTHDLSTQPEIEAITPEGVSARIDYNAVTRVATIYVESDHQANIYTVTFQQGPMSDDFVDGIMKDVWTVNNRDDAKFKTSADDGGYIEITATGGDSYQSGNTLKNYVTQQASGDWEAVTKISYDPVPTKGYQQFGVFVMQVRCTHKLYQSKS